MYEKWGIMKKYELCHFPDFTCKSYFSFVAQFFLKNAVQWKQLAQTNTLECSLYTRNVQFCPIKKYKVQFKEFKKYNLYTCHLADLNSSK